MNELMENFNEYFAVIPADTPQLLEEAFRLRYQVFCIEEHVPDFEAAKYPGGLETDVYDQRAVHSLLRHRPSGLYVGTVRLILPDPYDLKESFPIEQYTADCFDPKLIDLNKLPRAHTAEISRMVITRQFLSRRGEYLGLHTTSDYLARPDTSGRRSFPRPILGLVRGVIRMSAEQGITHLYAGMGRSLNRLLGPFGLQLPAIGPVVDYHGPRRPHLGVVDEVLRTVYEQNYDVWELLTDKGRVWPAPSLQKIDMAAIA